MMRVSPANEPILLGLLPAGHRATVETVFGGADEVHRLREIGLRDGASVQMLQPGNPCLVRLGGHKLGLRSEALTVLVRPEPRA